MADRNRLTLQAIADLQSATDATLHRDRGGYRVEVANEHGKTFLLDRVNNPVVYSSRDAAKRAIERHNPSITPVMAPQKALRAK
jgi:hypothetical protein